MKGRPIDASVLKRRVLSWAGRLRVEPKEIHVRPMRRKWASCSSRGRISLSADLLKQRRPFIDEVVVHELLHLKYPKHGKVFKALLKAYLKGAGKGNIEWDR